MVTVFSASPTNKHPYLQLADSDTEVSSISFLAPRTGPYYETDAFAMAVGVYRARSDHNKRWYSPTASTLRAEYGWNKKAYEASFRPLDEDVLFTQNQEIEAGMKCFAKIQRVLSGRKKREHYHEAGRRVFNDLAMALSHQDAIQSTSEYVFLAVDFEGHPDRFGVNECGFAKLDMTLVTENPTRTSTVIEATNYAITRRHTDRFLFGDTTKAHADLRPAIVRDAIEQATANCSDDSGEVTLSQRKVIILGHSVHSDMNIMGKVGASIESMQVLSV